MNFLKRKFSLKDNILTNEIFDDTTKGVVDFYNVKPFPNYTQSDNKASILNKGNKNYLAKKFKDFTGFNKRCLK